MRFQTIALACAALACVASASAQTIAYPPAHTVAQTDTLHAIAVADPYRWLEADVRTTPEVRDWVTAENAVTHAYLETLPARDRIAARLRELWNYDKVGLPKAAGGRYFFRIQSGLQNQAALYVQEGIAAAPRLLLDPNTWSQDGATALDAIEPSPDGTRLAYSIQDGGTDWRIIRILDVATGEDLSDEIRWVKFSDIVWAPDSQSLFYARYPEPPEGQTYTALNYNHAVYRHTIGQPQAADMLIYARPQSPSDNMGVAVTDDGRKLVVTVSQGTDERYEIVLIDLTRANAQPQILIPGFENDYTFAGQDLRGALLFRTDRNAPRGRVIAVDPAHPEEGRWREVVREDESVLASAHRVGQAVIAVYLKDAYSVARRYRLDGRLLGEIALPGVGTVEGFEGQANNPETFFSYSSFNQAPTIYRYDTRAAETSVFKAPDAPFDPADYVVEQRFYTSKDGTRVPMFIVHRRDMTPNGARPTLLYAYGGFNLAQPPGFSIPRLQWMEMGGVFVLANIRGGGEYGAAWHDGGRLHNKQNVFDDMIAAGEHLVSSGWTSPAHLAIQGRSNGGLLVGAVINQRPDLFAAALPQVGVMDMLRFNQFSAGRFWTDDYGDPANEADFATLLSYSPYHNIRPDTVYPAILITTADTDDRVVPGHSFKYAARIQAAQGSDAQQHPRLIRIETRAGHGTGRSTDQLIAETADMWAFIAHHTRLEAPQ